MVAQHPVRLSIELVRAGETVSGQIAVEGSSPEEFFGWLELIDRITRASGERRIAFEELQAGSPAAAARDLRSTDRDRG
jgi:hypothetical protein